MRNIVLSIITTLLLTLSAFTSAASPVRMALLQNDIHHLAFWVALDQGYLIEGQDVEVAGLFRAGPEIMTAFSAGALDMAYVGLAPSVTAVANKTAQIVVVSQANAVGSALVVAVDAPLQSFAGLAGKTIAVPGHATVQDFLLKHTLSSAGMALNQINIIVLKPPEMIGALRSGQIDGFIAWEPYPSQAATLNVGRNLLTSRDMWPDHPCCAVVASQAFLTDNADKVQAVVAAHHQATDFILEYPEKAAAIGVKHTGLDTETISRAMQTVDFSTHLNLDSVKAYVQFLADLGYIRVANVDTFMQSFIYHPLVEKSAQP